MHDLAARKRFFARLLIATVPAVLLAAYAHGYEGQSPYVVDMNVSSNQARCDGQVQVVATVRDAESGALVSFQTVKWDFKKSLTPGDSVTPKSTETDENGQTSVTVRFGNAEGRRLVRATIITEWPTTVGVTCAGGVTQPTPGRTPRPTPTKTPRSGPAQTRQPSPDQQQPGSSPTPIAQSTASAASPTAQATSAATPSVPAATPLTTAMPVVTPDGSSPSQGPSTSSAPTPQPSAAPQPEEPAPAMGLATIGLIGLVGVGVGAATFFFLRRR